MSVTQESLVYGTGSPFLCVLTLASLVQCNIESIYPDCGEENYKLIFNQIISPPLSVFTINCEKFNPDHIVPLVFIDDNAKSINESKKRKSSEPKLNPPKQSKISFPRSSESGPLKIESTLVIPATPSLLDSGGYTQSKTSNTLDTEVNSQIKSQDVTIPTRKNLQPNVPIEKARKYDIARRNQGCFRRFANFRILKMSLLLWKVISCDIFTQMRLLNAPWVRNLSYSQIKT